MNTLSDTFSKQGKSIRKALRLIGIDSSLNSVSIYLGISLPIESYITTEVFLYHDLEGNFA